MANCIAASTLGTAPDTYLYALARSDNHFATIGSDDSLRLFDGSLKVLHKHAAAHVGIACLEPLANGFVTAGRDGTVRFWPANGQRSGIELREPKGTAISAIACQDHLIAVGTESAKEGLGDISVLLYDTRNPSTPVCSYVDSHTDTITQLSFHPSQANVLLSASTDGLVSLFDTNVQEEDDALQQVLNPRSAVHCAGFLSPTEVYVVTSDEHFSVHSLQETANDDEPSSVINAGDVRERLKCMYVVDLIPGAHPVMVSGHNINETLSIVELDASRGWEFGDVLDLSGGHGEEVVRDVLVLDAERRVLSCGEDGQVKVWDLSRAMPRTL